MFSVAIITEYSRHITVLYYIHVCIGDTWYTISFRLAIERISSVRRFPLEKLQEGAGLCTYEKCLICIARGMKRQMAASKTVYIYLSIYLCITMYIYVYL